MVWSSAVYRAVVRDAGAPLLVVSPSGRIRYANGAALSLVGRRQLSGVPTWDLVPEPARDAVAAFLESIDPAGSQHGRTFGPLEVRWAGQRRVVELTAAAIRGVPGFRGTVVTVHDLTEHADREAQLARQAYTDELTGLANRALAMRHLAAASSPRAPGSLLLVDIDGFQAINDTFGHPEGDRVLTRAAHRVARAVPRGTALARLGGDEFLVLVPDTAPAQAADLARELARAIRMPLDVAGTPLRVTASIGVAPLAAATPEDVLTHAAQALYEAKGHGGGAVATYGPTSRTWASRRLDLVTQVEHLRADVVRARAEARTDPVTGLPNVRRLREDIPALQEHALLTHQPFGVVFLDLDRFGQLNKHLGDEVGDRTLAVVAAILASQCRSGDTFYRKGGEEFVGLLQNTDLRAALLVGERLRAAVEAAGLPHGGEPDTPVVTVSVGVAAGVPGQSDVADALVEAGHAMLRAKELGRNRVHPEAAPAPPPGSTRSRSAAPGDQHVAPDAGGAGSRAATG